ncbi:MAG: adenylate/guanylate cyclase domain-containing protein [Corynebacterium sp.]|nr:adenylate/guanylate cyclase domain-containing protein [Corynebacterium sp.]
MEKTQVRRGVGQAVRYGLVIVLVNALIAGVIAGLIALDTTPPRQLQFTGIGIGIVGLLSGAISVFLLFRPIIAWLREPTGHDPTMIRGLVLRIPPVQSVVALVIWALALLVLTLVAPAPQRGPIALIMAVGMAFSAGLTFLWAKWLMRPLARVATSGAAVNVPAEIPLDRQIILTWATTSALPLAAVGVLGRHDVPLLLGIGSMIVVGGVAAVLLADLVRVPLRDINTVIEAARHGDTLTQVPPYDGSSLGSLQAGFNELSAGVTSGNKVRELLDAYVGRDVAARALAEDPELGGESRTVAVLFIDVISSTAFAAERSPQEVVTALNEFFEQVVAVIHEHKGIVNKFQGDAALAIFGAPTALPDATGQALAAARDMQQQLRGLQLKAGIGVATGDVVAGHIGAHNRFEYTVIGDTVNAASRLTDLAKDTPGHVLTTATTLAQANEVEQAHWTLMKSVELRGRGRMSQLARPIRPTLADRS